MASILLVDDCLEILEVEKLMLESAGHSVITASNGKEAIRLVQTQKFDLVITDLIMPEKDGIETIMELHQAVPALKIIAVSGGGSCDAGGYLEIAKVMGAARTLTKPFLENELIGVVDETLRL